MELIYGTGNPAKLSFMKRALEGLPCEIIGLTEAALKMKIVLSEIEERSSGECKDQGQDLFQFVWETYIFL